MRKSIKFCLSRSYYSRAQTLVYLYKSHDIKVKVSIKLNGGETRNFIQTHPHRFDNSKVYAFKDLMIMGYISTGLTVLRYFSY